MCSTDHPQWLLASRKRRLLAIYVDFVLFSAVYGVAHHFAEELLSGNVYKLLGFALLEACLLLGWKRSVGLHFLSIRRAEEGKLLVDPAIYQRESWLTIFLGVLLLLDGSKAFVRWTTFAVPRPSFGILPPQWVLRRDVFA